MAGGRAASGPSFAKVPKPMEPPSAGKLLAAARARPPAGIPAAPAAAVLKRPSAAEGPASKKGKGGELEEEPAGAAEGPASKKGKGALELTQPAASQRLSSMMKQTFKANSHGLPTPSTGGGGQGFRQRVEAKGGVPPRLEIPSPRGSPDWGSPA